MIDRCKTRPPKIHIGDILRPPTAKDARGQVTGSPTVVASGVMFSMEPLRGNELEVARQQFAAASVLVVLHLNRGWNLTTKDSIISRGGPLDGRELNIGHIRDEGLLGLDTEIVCGEGDLS